MNRSGVRRVIVLLCVAVCAAAGATAAAAAARQSKSALLSGETEIRKLRVLRVTKGADRGSMLVWARVAHASPAPGVSASPAAAHKGSLRVKLKGPGGSFSGSDASPLLDTFTPTVPPGELAHGYRVRIPRTKAKALTEGKSGAIDVSIRANQRFDLEGDGKVDATSADRLRDPVKPKAVAGTIDPEDGSYRFPANNPGDPSFQVQSDVITSVTGRGSSTCTLVAADRAAVDPATGGFSFTGFTYGPQYPAATLKGKFINDTFARVATGELNYYTDSLAHCGTLYVDGTGWVLSP